MIIVEIVLNGLALVTLILLFLLCDFPALFKKIFKSKK